MSEPRHTLPEETAEHIIGTGIGYLRGLKAFFFLLFIPKGILSCYFPLEKCKQRGYDQVE